MKKHINQEQRYEISSLKKAGKSKTAIAAELGVHKSTIGRELKRNSDKGKYSAKYAQEFAEDRKFFKKRRQTFTSEMKKIITAKINKYWSPEQIVGRCKLEGISMVSHESIYQYVWSDKKQGGALYLKLRNSHIKYKKRYGKKDNRGIIPNKKSINQRSEIINNKLRIGDWEIDLIIGKGHKGAILTATERKTHYELVAKLSSKSSKEVKRVAVNMFAPYKKEVLSITSDNGREFFEHEALAKKLNCDYFFANPYSSWERGLNEYQNKLLRQFIPKKSDFNLITPERLIQIQNNLNARPRKTLNYLSPNELFLNTKVAFIT